MPIKIYNTLTRKKEEFRPQNPPEVKMYTCGVTVYDDCHIGHARSLYIFDVIKRYLEYRGYKVKFVRNITDVDDKIINKATQSGVTFNEVAKSYTKGYLRDLQLLRIGVADREPKATENIPEMIKYIEGLIDKGYAYESGGDVYFSVRKFQGYGKLSGQSLDQMIAGTRKEPGENKSDPLDFALWKKSKEGEPHWKSPWGMGRPGWHIECSVMSQKFLKTDTLDIHAGGRDLIFPHHENEIAQAEALTGRQFAKYWIHHGLLTIDGQKMAKSLGNFITIKDALSRYPADILKVFYLQSHYSNPVDFSWEKMEEVKKAYERIIILRKKLKEEYGMVDATKSIKGGTGLIKPFKDKFIECMDNNFDTPGALAVLFDMVNRCNKLIDSNDELKNFTLNYALSIMKEMTDIFGLTFLEDEAGRISEEKIKNKIKLRSEYKEQRKYREADRIREELEKDGIILEDAKDGTTWRRKL